jgi:hypothetical protein
LFILTAAPTGVQGTEGSQGIQGNTASQGTQGVQGTAALWNFTGAYNIGASYAVGDVATYDGKTWYRINSNGGNTGDTPTEGTFWTLLADQGAQGIQGIQGIQGNTGTQGSNGIQGTQGNQGVTQNDHGLLFGLGDDDHNQYLHINTSRTVEANHTFTNGLTISSGLLSAASGNFTNLEVNNIPVSLEKSVIVHVNNSNISATGSSAREYVYIFSDLATNYALILPTAVNNKGIFTLKNNTTGTVYLQTSVGQTIDGYSDIGLNRQYISISVISDGSNWIIV